MIWIINANGNFRLFNYLFRMDAYNYLYSVPYVIVFLLILFLFFIESRNINKGVSNRPIHIIVFGLLLLFIGLRGFIYTDWIIYYQLFELLPTLWDWTSIDFSEAMFEPGFLIYCILIKSIFPDYHFWTFVSALIDLIILSRLFKKYTNYYVLAFICFFAMNGIGMEFNLYRNSKAIVIFILSLDYIYKGRFVPYLLLNLLGATFHLSALIFIPLYFLLNKEISQKIMISIFVVGNILFLLKIKWISFILLPIISLLTSGIIAEKSMIYLETGQSYGITIGYIERVVTFILFFLFYKKLVEISPMNRIFYNIYLLYFISFFYFTEIEVFAGRFSMLFTFSYWVLYPNLYGILKTVSKKLIFLSLFIVYSLMRIIQTNNNIFAKYDNIFFGIESFQQRKNTFDKYSNTLFD